MSRPAFGVNRRHFLGGLAWSATALAARGAFAEELLRTPEQTEGPYPTLTQIERRDIREELAGHPLRLGLQVVDEACKPIPGAVVEIWHCDTDGDYSAYTDGDTDNDLIVINDDLSPAVGEITHLSGRILDSSGHPVRNAVVEIWQVDNHGVYLHSGGGDRNTLDKHFQGFGRFTTGSSGEYYFRTIKPVPYPGRTPHIHFAIKKKGQEKVTTQCYVKGEPLNESDGVLRGIRDKQARDSVIIDFQPIPESRIGELAARFDIVLGYTPEA